MTKKKNQKKKIFFCIYPRVQVVGPAYTNGTTKVVGPAYTNGTTKVVGPAYTNGTTKAAMNGLHQYPAFSPFQVFYELLNQRESQSMDIGLAIGCFLASLAPNQKSLRVL